MKEFIDKLIERLEEESSQSLKDMIASKSNAGENFNSGMAGAFNKTIAIVNQLAEEYKLSEMPTCWIPCSKKMPEAGTQRDVWISIENEVISYKAKWYLDHFEWDNGFEIKERIVAWMSNDVPEPYMEGEAELYRAKSVDGEYQEYKGDWK